jgi:hypothetical protein
MNHRAGSLFIVYGTMYDNFHVYVALADEIMEDGPYSVVNCAYTSSRARPRSYVSWFMLSKKEMRVR